MTVPKTTLFETVKELFSSSWRKMSKFLTVLVAIVAFSTVDCLQNNNEAADKTVVKNSFSSGFDSNVRKVADATAEALITFSKFAENYEPQSSKKETVPSTPEPDEKLAKALEELSQSPTREHEKYIILIFLKLERFQTEHFKQTYEIGGNQLAKEFYRLTGIDYKPGDEPRFTYEAENWVEKHPELLEYKPIADEMNRIKKQ